MTALALIETRSLTEGVTAYQISGPSYDAVQAAIMNIMDEAVGHAEFRTPCREYSIQDGAKRWRSRGYVRAV